MSKKFYERKLKSKQDASKPSATPKQSSSGQKGGTESLHDRLITLFNAHPGDLFKTNEISKMLAIKSDTPAYQALRDELHALETSGELSRGSRRRYGLIPLTPKEVTGVLKIQPTTGNGVVHPDKASGLKDTILIRTRNLSNALHGDTVSVSLYAPKQGERPQGEVLQVIERAAQFVTGTVDQTRHQIYVRPESGKLRRDVIVTKRDLAGAKPGDKVKVELLDWDNEYRDPEGKVVEVFGKRGQFQVEMQALASDHGLSKDFPEDVVKESESFSETLSKEEIAKRLDLRKETIFTIDPEDAKDFDDAVSLVDNNDGTVTLGVHIADVSHYVTEGSALDREALYRGTSVYLAGGVIPMLPEHLSNNICSLKEGVERLTYSCMMIVEEATGKVLSSSFAKSVIKSAMRFSYQEAETRIVTGKGKHTKLLKRMRELSLRMYELRKAEGSIDFETSEVRFKFDASGNPISAYRNERLGTMKMIEDFMLAANRAVAGAVFRMGQDTKTVKPFLYRIHADPDPEKLRDLARLAKSLGYSFNPENASPKIIQKFLLTLEGKPEQKMLNGLMLRAMAKAVYAEHNVGHFGLAFTQYSHFTSPIRRYPDLIVHRMLEEYMSSGGMSTKRERYFFNIMPDIADQTSALERKAVEAERDSAKLAQLFVMRDKVGEEFPATITGVQHYGVFVELENGAEGLLHIRELPGYYMFDEVKMVLTPQRPSFNRGGNQPKPYVSSRQTYGVGDKLVVKLIRVNDVKRVLDFGMAEPKGELVKKGLKKGKSSH